MQSVKGCGQERAAGRGREEKERRRDGGGEGKEGGARPHTGVLAAKCWMDCLPSALTAANKGQSKGGEGAAGGGVIEKDRYVFSPPL